MLRMNLLSAMFFTIDQKVAKVAFRFVNPDRLIEFY